MPNTKQTIPFTGASWLDNIKKYEKYIPVMCEPERKSLAEGSFLPTRKRIAELDRLLSVKTATDSSNIIDKAWERQKKSNTK